MTVKLANLSDWRRADGQLICLAAAPDAGPRLIRFEVNAPEWGLYLFEPGEEARFLACGEGHGRVEFWWEGEARLSVSGEDAWWFTSDGIPTFVERPAAVSFTRPMRRRERNYSLELMQYLARENMERQLDLMRDEMRRQVDAAVAKANVRTGEIVDEEAGSEGDGASEGRGEGVGDAVAAAGSGGGEAGSADGKPAGDGPSKRSAGARKQGVPAKP